MRRAIRSTIAALLGIAGLAIASAAVALWWTMRGHALVAGGDPERSMFILVHVGPWHGSIAGDSWAFVAWWSAYLLVGVCLVAAAIIVGLGGRDVRARG